MSGSAKIRVLIVDDSAIVRKILTEALSGEPDIEVVGTAPDPYVARDKIVALKPDVITLDIEMPRMDGVTFLKRLMHHHPLPVIIISSLGQASGRATLEALDAGAVEVLAKPSGPYSVGELRQNLAAKIRTAAVARIRPASPPQATVVTQPTAVPIVPSSLPTRPFRRSVVIAIGASTGGTEALQKVMRQLPKDCPGIVIAQHIPAGFSRTFANRLNEICEIRVREAKDGDMLEQGLALVAPGNFHMLVKRVPSGYRVEVSDGPYVNYQRPAVDILFQSVAKAAGENAVGAILTGMGSDGALGMLAMKRAGARTIAQNEATCVVFGMPKEAIRVGAVDQILPLSSIASAIVAQARM
jgi:two-component system chemotaxis response regulator CheB